MARAAEEVGFDSIWVGDHLLYRGDGRPERGPWDAWTLLAGLAARDRARYGSGRSSRARLPPAGRARADGGDGRRDRRRPARARRSAPAGTRPSSAPSGSRSTTASPASSEAFEIVRRLLAGERVTLRRHVRDGRGRRAAAGAGATAAARWSGAPGRGCSPSTLPHVDAWNTWYELYGNTAEGFAAREREGRRAAPSAPAATRARSSAAPASLVVLDRAAGERPIPEDLRRSRGRRADRGAAFATWPRPARTRPSWSSSPITERSIRASATPWPPSTTPSHPAIAGRCEANSVSSAPRWFSSSRLARRARSGHASARLARAQAPAHGRATRRSRRLSSRRPRGRPARSRRPGMEAAPPRGGKRRLERRTSALATARDRALRKSWPNSRTLRAGLRESRRWTAFSDRPVLPNTRARARIAHESW